MTEIPEDVWEQARAVCPSHMFTPGVHFEAAHNATIQAIARAILAERERIAKEAENWDGYARPGEIASMIRGEP